MKCSDAFQRRERASEDYAIRQREKEKLLELKQRLAEQQEHLTRLSEHMYVFHPLNTDRQQHLDSHTAATKSPRTRAARRTKFPARVSSLTNSAPARPQFMITNVYMTQMYQSWVMV